MWKRNYPGIYEALKKDWSESVRPIMNALSGECLYKQREWGDEKGGERRKRGEVDQYSRKHMKNKLFVINLKINISCNKKKKDVYNRERRWR